MHLLTLAPSSFPFDSVSLPKVFTGLQIDRLNIGNWISLFGDNVIYVSYECAEEDERGSPIL